MSNKLKTCILREELFSSFSLLPINVLPTFILQLFYCLVTYRFLRFVMDNRHAKAVGQSFIDVVPGIIAHQRVINLGFLPLH